MATEENKDKLLYSREKIKQSLIKAMKETHSVSIEKKLKSNNMLSVDVKGKTQGAIAVKTDMISEVEGEYVLDSIETIDKMTEIIVKNAEAYKDTKTIVMVDPIYKPEEKIDEKTEPVDKGEDNNKSKPQVLKPEPVRDKKKQIRNIILSVGLAFTLGLAFGSKREEITDGDKTYIITEIGKNPVEEEIDDSLLDNLDIIKDNRSLVSDSLKGINSDNIIEAELIGDEYPEEVRVEMEDATNDYMKKIAAIEEQAALVDAHDEVDENASNSKKNEYVLAQIDINNQLLDLQLEVLEDLVDARTTNQELVQKHMDLGYDREAHESELEATEIMLEEYQNRIDEANLDKTRNNMITEHFNSVDLDKIENYEQYFNAYVTGIEQMEANEIGTYDEVFSQYENFVEKYGNEFNTQEIKAYIKSYKEGKEEGKDIEEINDSFFEDHYTVQANELEEYNSKER